MTPEEHLKFWRARLDESLPSFVYVVQGDADTPVKIGWAYDPVDRIKTMQTGNYQRLRLLSVVPGDRRFEAILHKRFKDHRLTGEWFHPEEEMLAFIACLSEQMVEAYADDGELPDFRRFAAWNTQARRPQPLSVRHIEPTPTDIPLPPSRILTDPEEIARAVREAAHSNRA